MNSRQSGSGGFPGFDYVERVGQALSSAAVGQIAIANDAWSQIKNGSYGFAAMMQSLAQLIEGQYGTMVEASRGPGFVQQPVWLYFDYSKATGGILQGVATITRVEAISTTLDKTAFAAFESNSESLEPDVYSSCDWLGSTNRSQIQVALDPEVIKEHGKPGQYISFILAQGRTSEAPLVIVMLRVRE
jgi:hypothetical protein